jgi:mannitol/fructose-specific phosphotransferase system IIA component
MTIVTLETVRLQARAHDKLDAIRQAGELLIQGGCVEPPYVNGMLAREQTMSTYLGNGVSIPHGQHEDLALVRRTGISVLQIPDGVEWEPGERAYLVIGIAATSNEHVGVLANLAEIIEDPEAAEQFARTTDPMLIIERLNRTHAEEVE